MRTAPAFQVLLQRFGVWRLGVSTIAGLSVLSLAAWLATREAPADAVLFVAVTIAAACAVAIACSLVRCSPVVLRWDGAAWSVGAPDVASGLPSIVGEIVVAIDLGAWLLLRFEPSGPARRRAIWLPVQRRGLESQWHALRCAVHAPHRRDPTGTSPGA